MNIFEQASRRKLRFNSGRGEFTTEQLWELSLSALDSLAQRAHGAIQAVATQSFIPSATTRRDTDAELQLEILKHVIGVKVAEAETAKERASKQARLTHLREIVAQKSDEATRSMSLEELQKMIAELEG